MDPIVIDAELDPRDWDALQLYVGRRFAEQRPSRRAWLTHLAIIVLLVAATVLGLREIEGMDLFSLVAGLLLSAVAFVLIQRQRVRAMRPTHGSPAIGLVRMRFDAAGIHSQKPGQQGFVEWPRVQAVDETGEHVFLPIDRTVAFIIPKRSLQSVPVDAFLAQLRQWHAARADHPLTFSEGAVENSASVPTSPIAVISEEEPRFWGALKANLLGGLRVALFRPVQPSDFSPGLGQVLTLFGIALAIALFFQWQHAGRDAEFWVYGLYTWTEPVLLGLLVCALIARSLSPRADTRSVLVVALAVAPYAIASIWLLSLLSLIPFRDDTPIFACAVGVVVFAVGVRVARAAYGFIRPATFFLMILVMVGVAVTVQYGHLRVLAWEQVPEDTDDDFDADWEAAESTLFAQPERIADAMQDVQPGEPGVSDVFYVGFAGDGSQRVFMREALYGQGVFARQMGSGPRSLDLINDEDDRLLYPLATMSGLHHALQLLANRMDPDEDILVLLLTSHGSQENGIYVNNGNLPLNDVEPEPLRRALDAAGIRWRVIIVSACYAGIFVEPLKSDTTLVITAADAEHNSFGCADDRDLTYFGEAFLRDALPRADSLQAAFESAREAIGERERAEHKTPSNPQMFVGASMQEKLASLGALPLSSLPPSPLHQRPLPRQRSSPHRTAD